MFCSKYHHIGTTVCSFLFSKMNEGYDETNKKIILVNCLIIDIVDGLIFNIWIPITTNFNSD